jgi:uncharacterized protein CbrC (UPF0167 family)
MSSPDRLPSFKYHADPLATHVFEASEAECPVCNRVTGYAYVGPYYGTTEVANLCPWCIADGQAAAKYDIYFVIPYYIEKVPEINCTQELQLRTPGYFYGSVYEWPAHCGDYCTLLRKVHWADISHLEDELSDDLNRLEVEVEEEGIEDRQAKRDALEGTALWAYLFRCRTCGKHRLAGSYE